MKKILIVIDMQNDFITGSLGTAEAVRIVPTVKEKIEKARKNGDTVIFTRDTHNANYLQTQEGKNLPVEHCIIKTSGHSITEQIDVGSDVILDKPTFGSLALAELIAAMICDTNQIELCGICTDICVVSNALILKARFPETPIKVDASCCAGVTVESHEAALLTMKMCQVDIIEEEL